MKKLTTLITLLALLLLLVGCGNKINSKLKELERKPAAADIKGAKALYDEARNLERWLEQKEKPSPEQMARVRALSNQRMKEGLALVAEKAKSGVLGALGGLGFNGSIDIGQLTEWFLGTKDPRVEKFGGPPTEPTQDGGSKGWR